MRRLFQNGALAHPTSGRGNTISGTETFPLTIFPRSFPSNTQTYYPKLRVGHPTSGRAGNVQILLRVTRFQPATLQQPCLIACLFAFLFKLMQQANKQTKLACLLFDLLFCFFVVGDSLRFARGMDHFSVTSTNILASSGLLLALLHFREFFCPVFLSQQELRCKTGACRVCTQLHQVLQML